jgi:hypothetical protein
VQLRKLSSTAERAKAVEQGGQGSTSQWTVLSCLVDGATQYVERTKQLIERAKHLTPFKSFTREFDDAYFPAHSPLLGKACKPDLAVYIAILLDVCPLLICKNQYLKWHGTSRKWFL